MLTSSMRLHFFNSTVIVNSKMDYCYPSKFVIEEVGRSCWSINWIHLLWSRSLFSWPLCHTKYWYYEEKCWSLFLLKGNVDKCNRPIARGDHITAAIAAATAVILVTNSYGESRDSSCEKSWVPVQNQWVPVQNPMSPKLKILGPLCNQTFHLKTDSKTLQ